MIHKINVLPDTNASNILFFTEMNLDELPDPRIVPLFGANGSGKTTLLKAIDEAIFAEGYNREEHGDSIAEILSRRRRPKRVEVELVYDDVKTALYNYRNSTDNFGKREVRFDPLAMSLRYDAMSLSEGQSIVYSVKALLEGMLKSTKKRESFVDDGTHAIVLLDEIDSGMSMDNIRDMMKIIQRVLKQKRNIQFIMSFNNPYVIEFFPIIMSMYDGKVHELHSANEMLAELDRNADMLKAARKKRNGDYKIFG